MRTLFLLCISLLAGGCVIAAQADRMVPPRLATPSKDSKLHGAIALTKVGGGETTSLMDSPKVDDEALGEALRRSLEQNGFLSDRGGDARFALEAFLIELKQPVAGFTMVVDSFIRYKLVATHEEKVVFDEIVTASYTATLGDAFAGFTRMKLANEGSIRENIASFLLRLKTLDPAASASK